MAWLVYRNRKIRYHVKAPLTCTWYFGIKYTKCERRRRKTHVNNGIIKNVHQKYVLCYIDDVLKRVCFGKTSKVENITTLHNIINIWQERVERTISLVSYYMPDA
jgi:hypothetical protein